MIACTIKKKQTGAVLIVSLIMLMLVTLIGISGMQTTVLEERMASNHRDQNTAFQAAEATILQARTYIESQPLSFAYPNTGGIADDAFFTTALWASASAIATPAGYGGNFNLMADPRYIVERISPTLLRVTARAVGASPGTQVILRVIYDGS